MAYLRWFIALQIAITLPGCGPLTPPAPAHASHSERDNFSAARSLPIERIRIGPTSPPPLSEEKNANKQPKKGPLVTQKTCDLDNIETGTISLKSIPGIDPDLIVINSLFTFFPGVKKNEFGKQVAIVDIIETTEIGSHSDWILKMSNDVASIVSSRLSQSCSDAVLRQSASISSYDPPTAVYEITAEKRHCASMDLPCGLPQVSCSGIFNCRTHTPMCRAITRTPLFSKTSRVEYQPVLSKVGEGRDQKVQVKLALSRQDVSTSSGEIYKLLENLGVLSAIHNVLPMVVAEINQKLSTAQSLSDLFFERQIPQANYIYLPETKFVKWGKAKNRPANSAPFSMILEKHSRLPKDLGCDLAKCLRNAKETGSLSINECFI